MPHSTPGAVHGGTPLLYECTRANTIVTANKAGQSIRLGGSTELKAQSLSTGSEVNLDTFRSWIRCPCPLW